MTDWQAKMMYMRKRPRPAPPRPRGPAISMTVAEVKRRILDGWELWHIAMPVFGRWEMRHSKHPTVSVCWDTILRIRRSALPWFEEHTEYIEDGIDGLYRHKQRRLLL